MIRSTLSNLLRRKQARLEVQGSDGSREIGVSPDAPLITIVGGEQSGKSVLALDFAGQLMGQGYQAVWFTPSRLTPGDEGYMESKASRYALHLESRNRDHFVIRETDALDLDILALLPRRSLIIIDDLRLLAASRDTAKQLIQRVVQQGSILVLIASTPADFSRIGLTDRHTKGVSLMLIGRLEAGDASGLPEPLQHRLARIRFVRDSYAEYLAISPGSNWSEVIRMELPDGI